MTHVISVIIPTLNEEQELSQTLVQLSGVEKLEIIVVDGGSDDGTVEMAITHGAQILSSPKGRGVQLNRGVKASSGKILLFLHADTRLPDKFADLIHKTLNRENYSAGAFSLQIDSPRMSLAIIAYCANMRSKFLQMPYGDQGIFISRNMYDRIGGFEESEIMEDFIFVRNIKKYGRIYILDEAAVTSDRRWQNIGVIRTTLINQLIVLGYSFGIQPSILAGWYQRLKGVRKK